MNFTALYEVGVRYRDWTFTEGMFERISYEAKALGEKIWECRTNKKRIRTYQTPGGRITITKTKKGRKSIRLSSQSEDNLESLIEIFSLPTREPVLI